MHEERFCSLINVTNLGFTLNTQNISDSMMTGQKYGNADGIVINNDPFDAAPGVSNDFGFFLMIGGFYILQTED